LGLIGKVPPPPLPPLSHGAPICISPLGATWMALRPHKAASLRLPGRGGEASASFCEAEVYAIYSRRLAGLAAAGVGLFLTAGVCVRAHAGSLASCCA
jgi:hypothetical protein